MEGGEMLGDCIAHRILSSEAHLSACLERYARENLMLYNPLDYAVEPHCAYVCNYGNNEKPIMFVGMNATANGMAQSGVPLGSLQYVKQYLGLESHHVRTPKEEHPKHTITGWDTVRSDPEGDRFWQYVSSKYPVRDFMSRCYVTTYCPVMYLNENGKEVLPPCLPHKLRNLVINSCDLHLIEVVDIIKPKVIIAIGSFTYEQVSKLFCSTEVGPAVYPLLHPAPSNAVSYKKWCSVANDQLLYAGVPQIIARGN